MSKERRIVILGALSLSCSTFWSQPAHAANLFVDCADGKDALVDAMTTANLSDDLDVIWIRGHCVFDEEYDQYGQNPPSRLPTVTTPMRLVGMSASGATLENLVNISNSRRMFFVESTGELRLNNLTVARSAGESGGAILNEGTLRARNVNFLDNRSSEKGGAVHNRGTATLIDTAFQSNETGFRGGAIYNESTLHVKRSAFLNNSDIDNGGAIFNDGGDLTLVDGHFEGNDSEDAGAVESHDGTVSIKDSVFFNNGGVYFGALRILRGSAYVVGSEFRGNHASYIGAGGISIEDATAAIVQTTIAENRMQETGAAALISWGSTVLVDRCTISENRPSPHSAYDVTSIQGSGFTIVNSTLSGNQATTDDGYSAIELESSALVHNTIWNNEGPVVLVDSSYGGNILGNSTGELACAFSSSSSQGFNLASDFSCDTQSALGDLTDTNPQLEPLANNGGPTLTHLPRPDSPALNAVPRGECTRPNGNPLFFDQRGVRRTPLRSCDIGAVERGGAHD